MSWGRFQGMHSSTAGTGGHMCIWEHARLGLKNEVPWLHPDSSKAAVHAPQHQGLGTLPPLPIPVDSENTLRISLAQVWVNQRDFSVKEKFVLPFRMFS